MFRTVRCTTALLAILSAGACGRAPTEPAPRPAAPLPRESVVPAGGASVCDPVTGVGCCYESQPWWC